MIEQSSRSLKIFLGVLLFVLLGVFVFVLMKKSNTSVNQSPVVTKTPVTENSTQPAPIVPPVVFEEAAKEAGTIQDQVKAGTLSAEEAKKQLDVIGAKLPTPPLPPEVKQ